MIRSRATCVLLGLVLCGPAMAQDAQSSAINLEIAADLCLRHYHDETAIVPAFETTGFTVTPWIDEGTFAVEAPGVTGYLTPAPYDNYCAFEAPLVPYAEGEAIARRAAARVYGDKVGEGHPEGLATRCPMLQVFAPGRLMIVEVFSAGNGGTCDDPTSSAILIQ